MYRVMLIDDEPIFLNDMRETLLKISNDADVVYESYDAMAALQAIPDCQPDIVFVDINMPGMDGLEFISEAKQILPDSIFIIVTGYRSFDYARRALQIGADDYILKPVQENELRKVLDKSEEQVQLNNENNGHNALVELVNGEDCNVQKIDKYFKYPYYGMIDVICQDQSIRSLLTQNAIYSILKPGERMWSLERPEQGETYIIVGLQTQDSSRRTVMINAVDGLQDSEWSVNVIVGPLVDNLPELRSTIERMKRDRDSILVFGAGAVYSLDRCIDPEDENKCNLIIQDFEKELGYYKDRLNASGLKKTVREAMQRCREARLSFRAMQKFLRESVFVLNRSTSFCQEIERQRIYNDIDEMAMKAKDYAALEIMYLQYFEEMFRLKPDNGSSDKSVFYAIKDYINANIDKRITVAEICNTFGISQSKLAKLFKKFYNDSFVKYLTKCKMDYARELLKREMDMTINDIASLLGYNDPLYFSKVFKSASNMSPTEYRKRFGAGEDSSDL